MANENKSNVSLNVGLGISVGEIQKEFNRASGFFKGFVTKMNKILEGIGSTPSLSSTNAISPVENIKQETKALLKQAKQFKSIQNQASIGQYYTTPITNPEETKNSWNELKIVGIYGFRALSRSFRNMIKDMSRAGAELYELNSRFSLIMGEMTTQAENFADKLGEAYGLNEATIKNNMLRLYTLAQNAGLANDQALELTKTMSRLGVEVASVWDVPIEQATDNLISALQGLPRAMKKYGSYVGTEEIKDFYNQFREQQGLEPLTRELTRQEKVLGVYLKSLSDLGYSFGDFERTVNSTANQLRIMQETIITLRQTGGEIINTVLSPLLKFVNQFLKVVSKLAQSLQKLSPFTKFILGALMLFILTLPMIVGTGTLFIYYITKMKKSLATLSKKFGESSLKAKAFFKTIASVAKWSAILIGFVASIQMIEDAFSKTAEGSDDVSDALKSQQNAAKNLKRTLSSFDDVNVFRNNESENDSIFGNLNIEEFLDSIDLASDELTNLNGLFEETTEWAKGLSISFLAIDIIGFVSQFVDLKKALSGVWTWIKNNYKALGAWSVLVIGIIGLVKNVVEIFNKWGDMSVGQRIVSILTAVASGFFLVAAGIAAIKQDYIKATMFGALGATLAIGGSSILANISKNNKEVSANNVGSNSSVVSSAYNPNDTTGNIGTSISNAVMAGISGVNGNNKPINVNVNVNVDEEYIYKAYNNVAKQNGVM